MILFKMLSTIEPFPTIGRGISIGSSKYSIRIWTRTNNLYISNGDFYYYFPEPITLR